MPCCEPVYPKGLGAAAASVSQELMHRLKTERQHCVRQGPLAFKTITLGLRHGIVSELHVRTSSTDSPTQPLSPYRYVQPA